MTVSYSYAASTATSFTFWRLMAYWRGSIWKIVYRELLVWFLVYLAIQLTFRFAILDSPAEGTFLGIVTFGRKCYSSSEMFLMLGFFTTMAIGRFWAIYQTLHWPDNAALTMATLLRSSEEAEPELCLLRKTTARYIMLCFVLVLRDISEPVRRRFPTLRFLQDHGGLLTDAERVVLEGCMPNNPGTCKYWVPIAWLVSLLKAHYARHRADRPGQPGHLGQYAYLDLARQVLTYRSRISDVLAYDWVPVPLAYTQLCVIVVYIELGMRLLNDQVVERECDWVHFVQPVVFSAVKLMILLGWLKSASILLNPFGSDDDDLEVSYLIDRHWATVTRILERPLTSAPEQPHDDLHPQLPHTRASRQLLKKRRQNPMVGSVANFKIRRRDAQIARGNPKRVQSPVRPPRSPAAVRRRRSPGGGV